MSDLNDALKDSYIGKVADALQPYTAELTREALTPPAASWAVGF